MKFRIYLFVFLPFLLLTTSIFSQTITEEDRLKSNRIIEDNHLNPTAKDLLKKFYYTMNHFSDSSFLTCFSKESVEYYQTSELWKDYILIEGLWMGLSAPTLEWPNCKFPVEFLMLAVYRTNLKEMIYVGKDSFGNGYRFYFIIELNDGVVVAGRIFLHRSGPNGSFEIHSAYG